MFAVGNLKIDVATRATMFLALTHLKKSGPLRQQHRGIDIDTQRLNATRASCAFVLFIFH
jgi:hypothetical protein